MALFSSVTTGLSLLFDLFMLLHLNLLLDSSNASVN